ncbi:hypothetical protein XI06_13820 [Bradyrhizobium sp. CCBAU 11434]|nr:hypothetical protein [Bradyrhizobium sp. CCBAU 11434]
MDGKTPLRVLAARLPLGDICNEIKRRSVLLICPQEQVCISCGLVMAWESDVAFVNAFVGMAARKSEHSQSLLIEP